VDTPASLGPVAAALARSLDAAAAAAAALGPVCYSSIFGTTVCLLASACCSRLLVARTANTAANARRRNGAQVLEVIEAELHAPFWAPIKEQQRPLPVPTSSSPPKGSSSDAAGKAVHWGVEDIYFAKASGRLGFSFAGGTDNEYYENDSSVYVSLCHVTPTLM